MELLQWVALAGRWRVVMVTTRCLRRAPILGLRPGRGATFSNPVTPSARNRLRQRETFFGVMDTDGCDFLVLLARRRNRTMRARSATRTGRDRLRAWDSNTVRCSRLKLMAGAMRIRDCLLTS